MSDEKRDACLRCGSPTRRERHRPVGRAGGRIPDEVWGVYSRLYRVEYGRLPTNAEDEL